MQTFTFSASEDNMESKVSCHFDGGGGGGRAGKTSGIMYNKNNLLKKRYGIDLICYYTLLQTPHKMSIKELIIM